MTPSPENVPDDDRLVAYLLGTLSEEETERFDELSIADDEFASRLRSAENDLIDAYVRGELSGATLGQFRSSYLILPARLQRVNFAEALLAFENRAGTATVVTARAQGWRWVPQLGLAAAAVLAVIAAGYLFSENRRLEQQVSRAQAEQSALEQKAQVLGSELHQERSRSAGMQEELARLRDSVSRVRPLPTLSFLLLPQRRGTDQMPTVNVPKAAERLTLRLQLESDGFSAYEATLRDPATGNAVWQSGQISPTPEGADRSVAVIVPAAVLKNQNYTLELAGKSARGPAEFVSSYAFRVVLE